MKEAELKQYKKLYREELDRCIDFWMKYGYDRKHGGVYTCLDRTGKMFSTDKSVWFQGRCGWIFAHLCNQYGARPEWLEIAKSCVDFIDAHCIDTDGRMFFTVTEDGKPLRKRRYFFSETFSIIAHAEYAKASGDAAAMAHARKYFEFVDAIYRDRANDPFKITPKVIAQTRSGRSLAEPMILLNVASVMRESDPENAAYYLEKANGYTEDIFRYHYKEDLHCLLETVGVNGELQDNTTAGRVINPGHDIECSWFLLAHAEATGNEALAKKAETVFNDALARGWDKEYDGVLYFVDVYGFPPEQYEHDMKLWWVHNETIIGSLMLYKRTGNEKYLEIFRHFTEYAFRVFSDPEYGDWYGYLRRDGKPTLPACKGSTFKGPFHLPRMLMMVDAMLAD